MAKAKIPIWKEEPPDPQQKFFRLPNWFNEPLWLERADRIAEHANDLERTTRYAEKWNNLLPWDVGDWLLDGEAGKVPIKELREIAAQKWPKHAWHTLRNWKVTARAIEPSRRRDGRGGSPFLPYSVHQVVEKYAPVLQEMFLQQAVKRGLSVGGLKEVIKENSKLADAKLFGKPYPSKVTVNIKMPITEYEKLKALATAKHFSRRHRKRWAENPFFTSPYDPDVAGLLWWMALEYFKEHKAELVALLKPAKS